MKAGRRPACSGRWERAARERGFRLVAGVDEVGRGALFGPVCAGAVVLDPERPIRGLRDSKELDAETREELAGRIRERAVCWAVAGADAFEIDRVNILQATKIAMRRAIAFLNPVPDYLLIDALTLDLPIAQEGLTSGDAKVQCIAAASIMAKVARDSWMREWDQVFPAYGLASNKGYGTDHHYAALREHGPTSLHRFSFWPVRDSGQLTLWSGYDGISAPPHATVTA